MIEVVDGLLLNDYSRVVVELKDPREVLHCEVNCGSSMI